MAFWNSARLEIFRAPLGPVKVTWRALARTLAMTLELPLAAKCKTINSANCPMGIADTTSPAQLSFTGMAPASRLLEAYTSKVA